MLPKNTQRTVSESGDVRSSFLIIVKSTLANREWRLSVCRGGGNETSFRKINCTKLGALNSYMSKENSIFRKTYKLVILTQHTALPSESLSFLSHSIKELSPYPTPVSIGMMAISKYKSKQVVLQKYRQLNGCTAKIGK